MEVIPDASDHPLPEEVDRNELRVMRVSVITRLIGVSRSTLYRWESDPAIRFPRRIVLSPGLVVYRAIEIRDWLDARERATVGAPLPSNLEAAHEAKRRRR